MSDYLEDYADLLNQTAAYEEFLSSGDYNKSVYAASVNVDARIEQKRRTVTVDGVNGSENIISSTTMQLSFLPSELDKLDSRRILQAGAIPDGDGNPLYYEALLQ